MYDHPPISWGIMTENAGGRLVGKKTLEVVPVHRINGEFDKVRMRWRQPESAADIGGDVTVFHRLVAPPALFGWLMSSVVVAHVTDRHRTPSNPILWRTTDETISPTRFQRW